MSPRALLGALRQRWRRYRYANTLSAPYLSGDLFRGLCHAALDSTDASQSGFLAGYRAARAIFVKTDRLPEFLGEFASRAAACRVLITGNSDHEIHEVPAGLPPRLRCWFAQNSFVTGERVRPLPIGLENHRLGRNGVLRHYRACDTRELAAKRPRILGAFGPTSPERRAARARRAGAALVDLLPARLAPRRYQARLRQYRFVLAPRGNGIDTHRFWEALYADAIPITRRTPWSAGLRAEGVPFVEVDDWDELRSWTDADLARLSRELPVRPSATPWLWEPFWRARLSSLAAEPPPAARAAGPGLGA
jgi:hypothetical protein